MHYRLVSAVMRPPLIALALLALVLAVVATACGDADAPEEADAAIADGPDAGPSACLGTVRKDELAAWTHVDEGSPIEYATEPPSSGSHYPRWARYQIHADPLPRGHWVHNLEHGAVVLLHGPSANAEAIEDLAAAYDTIPDDPACGHKRALLAPDANLESAVAVVAAGRVLVGDCVDADAIAAFVEAYRGDGPEDVCAEGFIP